MDALIVLIALGAVAYISKREVREIEISISETETGEIPPTKLNPNFYRDDNAFIKLYKSIVEKGHPRE